MLGRRFLLIVALLMGLTALAASVAPPEPRLPDRERPTPSPTTAPDATAREEAAPETDADLVETIDASAGGEPQRVRAAPGERVAIFVESDEPGSVALGELSVDAVDRDAPARFELFADEPATYPIVLVEEGRRVGVLEVSE